MNFQIVPNTAQGPIPQLNIEDHDLKSMEKVKDDQEEKQLTSAITTVAPSEVDNSTELMMERYLQLKIPQSYQVKFNFTPERVMTRLSKDRLRRLQKVWEQNGDGLDLLEFMRLMVLEVPSVRAEKLEMIHGLIRLFKQVDVNGDGAMEWSEFVQYIIDQVLSESIKATYDAHGNVTTIGDIIAEQRAGDFTRLKRSGVPVDKGKHRKPMQDVVMCEDKRKKENTLIMHSEENSKILQWYSLDLKVMYTEEVPCKGQSDRVLSVAFQDLSKSLYSFGPQGTEAVYGVLCTDHILYFYIRIRARIELFHQIDLSGIEAQVKVWYMPLHKAWLTAGKDFKIRQWNVSPLAKKSLMDDDPQQLHSDLITDCIEVHQPLSIATSSLDRSIVLFDLKKKEVLRRFAKKHVTGVRHLRYMKDFGGMIISTGYEIFANIWGPQNLFGNAHLGSLRGHRTPIVSVDIIQGRPFVYTLDTTNELIIWDVRSIQALQTVPAPGNKEKLCHGLIAISPELVWIYGHRFITYDPQEVWEDDVGDHDDMIDTRLPINAFHNQFFGTIFVQTAQDLKIYSCLDGQLMVLHQSVFKHKKINCTAIRQDKRQRKAYIASNAGQIEVMNIQSGVSLKSIFEDEDQKKELEESHRNIEAQLEQQRAERSEPTSPRKQRSEKASSRPETMQRTNAGQEDTVRTATGRGAFITEAKVQGTITTKPSAISLPTENTDSEGEEDKNKVPEKRDIVDMILVWEDTMNQLIYADKSGYFVYQEEDDSSELLRRVTGGHNSSVTAIEFSYHLSLIATGTETGEVGVWDYELSQLLGVCKGHSKSTGLITAISFLEPYPVMATAGLDGRICLWAVRPAPIEMQYIAIGVFNNFSFHAQDDKQTAVKSLTRHSGPNLKGVSRGLSMKHGQISADTYRDFKTNQVLATRDAGVRLDVKGNYRGLSQMKELRLDLLREFLKTNDAGRTNIETQFDKMRVKYLPRMESLDPEYEETIDEEKLRVMLYLGDDAGMIKLWDFTYVLKKSNLEPSQPFWQVRADQYFPSRKERVDASGYASRLTSLAQHNSKLMMEGQDPEDTGLIIRECVGHKKEITQLNQHNFNGLISLGNDHMVKIWSHGLDLWGTIDCRHYEQDPLWYFPTKDKKQSELNDIAQMQILADQLRQEDEQAVQIERNQKADDEEHFDSNGVYRKFSDQNETKKLAERIARDAETDAINEERQEWNEAMSKARVRPNFQVVLKKKDQDLGDGLTEKDRYIIGRVETLVKRNQQIQDDIEKGNEESVEVKGDVVEKTASQMDRLIYLALRKHGKPMRRDGDEGSASPNRRRITNKRNSFARSPLRSGNISDTSSTMSVSPGKNIKKNLSKLKLTKNDSSTNLGEFSTPLLPKDKGRELFEDSDVQIKIALETPISTRKNKSILIGSAARSIENDTTSRSSVKQLIPPFPAKQIGKMMKNAISSNLSLVTTSGVGMTEQKRSIMSTVMEPISPITEEKGNDDSELGFPSFHVERKLDELNQTKALMRKIETVGGKTAKFRKYASVTTVGEQRKFDKNDNMEQNFEETKDDRKHLVQFKNLPSIRDRLLSIKTKQQITLIDPKYNIVIRTPAQTTNKAIVDTNNNSQHHLNHTQGRPQRKQHPMSTTASQQAKFGALRGHLSQGGQSGSLQPSGFGKKKKNHAQLMSELAVIAKDLEIYNANNVPSHFNERARSQMIVAPAQRQMQNHLLSGSQSTASMTDAYHPDNIPYLQNIKDISIMIGHEGVSSGMHSRKNEKDVYRMQSQGLHPTQDVGPMRAVRSQMLDHHNQKELIRTPQEEFNRQFSRLQNHSAIQQYEKNQIGSRLSLKKNNSMQRIANVHTKMSISTDLQTYGAKNQQNLQQLTQAQERDIYGPQISIDYSTTKLDVKDHGARNSRNVAHHKFNTDSKASVKSQHKDTTLPTMSKNFDSEMSAALKQKMNIAANMTAEDQTAAMSNENDMVTMIHHHNFLHDASRQFLDYNVNINEAADSSLHAKKISRWHQQSQILPHNASLSNVSASQVNFSDVHHAQVEEPLSLYSDAQGLKTSGRNNKKKILRTVENVNESANWKARRRVSEQTRMNLETGKLEHIDMLMEKKNSYLALKQKYTGKDSDMQQLMKREAQNIQAQRARIRELKDFKAMMHNLKKSNSPPRIRQPGTLAAALKNK